MSADAPGAEEVLRELAGIRGEDLAHQLRTASRAVDAALVGRIAALGHRAVRLAHAAVFLNLDPAGTRMVTLAQRAGISRQAIGQLVHDLQTAGYLEVVPDPDDGRATLVLLTDLGVAFCAQAARTVRELEQEWREQLGDAAFSELRRALILLRGREARPL